MARTYGAVVFGNESLDAGVIELHESYSLECSWATAAECSSLSNTPKNMFSLLSCMLNLTVLHMYVLFKWVTVIISSIKIPV